MSDENNNNKKAYKSGYTASSSGSPRRSYRDITEELYSWYTQQEQEEFPRVENMTITTKTPSPKKKKNASPRIDTTATSNATQPSVTHSDEKIVATTEAMTKATTAKSSHSKHSRRSKHSGHSKHKKKKDETPNPPSNKEQVSKQHKPKKKKPNTNKPNTSDKNVPPSKQHKRRVPVVDPTITAAAVAATAAATGNANQDSRNGSANTAKPITSQHDKKQMKTKTDQQDNDEAPLKMVSSVHRRKMLKKQKSLQKNKDDTNKNPAATGVPLTRDKPNFGENKNNQDPTKMTKTFPRPTSEPIGRDQYRHAKKQRNVAIGVGVVPANDSTGVAIRSEPIGRRHHKNVKKEQKANAMATVSPPGSGDQAVAQGNHDATGVAPASIRSEPIGHRHYRHVKKQEKEQVMAAVSPTPPGSGDQLLVQDNNDARRRHLDGKSRAKSASQAPPPDAAVILEENDNEVFEDEIVVNPGAVRVIGPGGTLNQGDSAVSFQQRASIVDMRNSKSSVFVKEEPGLIQAELVTSAHNVWDNMDSHDNVAYAKEAIPVRPLWKQRMCILLGLLVVVGVTVGIAVPLANKNSSDGGENTTNVGVTSPTTIPTISPSMIPSVSMAPTSIGLTTVVIQLDENPQQVGWRLDCDNENIANFPVGVYQGFAMRLVTAQFAVLVGQRCTFTLFDSGNDGLTSGLEGFARFHFGSAFATNETLIFEQEGNFTDQVQVEFFLEAPPTSAPSLVPSVAPSFPDEGEPDFPTASPIQTSIPGPPVRPPVPTPTPEPTPTEIIFPTPPPTSPISVNILIEIQLDAVPAETGYNLTCGDEVLSSFSPLSFGDPNQLVSQVVTTHAGTPCTFFAIDSFGDGLCCQFQPQGFYRLFAGDRPSPDNLYVEGGEFGFFDRVDIVAREPNNLFE